jgi:hypothetical protein
VAEDYWILISSQLLDVPSPFYEFGNFFRAIPESTVSHENVQFEVANDFF